MRHQEQSQRSVWSTLGRYFKFYKYEIKLQWCDVELLIVWDWKFHANLRKARNRRDWMIRLFMKGSPMNSSTKTRLRNLYRGLPLFQTQSPAWNAGLLEPGLCRVVMSSPAILRQVATGHWSVTHFLCLTTMGDPGQWPVCPHTSLQCFTTHYSPHGSLWLQNRHRFLLSSELTKTKSAIWTFIMIWWLTQTPRFSLFRSKLRTLSETLMWWVVWNMDCMK